eukprot:TRINITY_DN11283_c0_g1_i1.p1 TRINITY_DN11283_c0_g1~~TRINITY_DN11283_c0_g1_i1.p1  ORF type:complete len:92 (+),score=16.94 TRINITY_DN11283_c0_g1_i1:20-295(+)
MEFVRARSTHRFLIQDQDENFHSVDDVKCFNICKTHRVPGKVEGQMGTFNQHTTPALKVLYRSISGQDCGSLVEWVGKGIRGSRALKNADM